MDNHTPEQRRRNMKAVKNKGSKIETMLQKELWHRGLRYRKNAKTVYGKPATVSSFTDMIGKTKTKRLSPIVIFGYLKSKRICNVIGK